MKQLVYMDNAATTRVCDSAVSAMIPFMEDYYANVKGSYSFARKCEKMMEESRQKISATIGALPEEIYFNSGGTEGDNQAIRCIPSKNVRILTSMLEHEAVLKSCDKVINGGGYVEYAPVKKNGMVDVQYIAENIHKFDIISIMLANNEVGVIQPIELIGAMKRNGILHTDAVQAYGHIPIDVNKLNIDILNVSAHKFGGPKGIGFMYIRKGLSISPLIVGGGQERGIRSGTSNTAAISGMCAAAVEAVNCMNERNRYITNIRNYMIDRIVRDNPKVYINGEITNRLPGNINVSFEGVSTKALIAYLDDRDICVSRASACSNIDNSLSHVLSAMGVNDMLIRGSLRISISHENTFEEAQYVCDTIREGVAMLRNAIK